jgi:hypothetical protein
MKEWKIGDILIEMVSGVKFKYKILGKFNKYYVLSFANNYHLTSRNLRIREELERMGYKLEEKLVKFKLKADVTFLAKDLDDAMKKGKDLLTEGFNGKFIDAKGRVNVGEEKHFKTAKGIVDDKICSAKEVIRTGCPLPLTKKTFDIFHRDVCSGIRKNS